MIKKYLPNFLTTLRIIASAALLFMPVFSEMFMIMYIFAGATDMLDGFLARKLNAASKFGSKYDSTADYIFVIVCLVKILPHLVLGKQLVIWTCIIAAVKIFNLIYGIIRFKKAVFLHTAANKITGFLLFLLPIIAQWISVQIPTAVICILASFAALQEFYIINTGRC